MAEYQIYHLVNQLMQLFDVDQTNLSYTLAEQMIASIQTPQNNNSTKEALEKLSLVGNRQLIEQYKDLKDTNVYEADALVQFAAKLYNDKAMRNFLKLHEYIKRKMAERAEKRAAANAAAAAAAANVAANAAVTLAAGTHLDSMMSVGPASQQYPSTTNGNSHYNHHQHHINQQHINYKPPPPPKPQFKSMTPLSSPCATTVAASTISDTTTITSNHNRRRLETLNVTSNSFNDNSNGQQHQQQHNQTNNIHNSSISITPASRKSKAKDKNWKNDALHQKMKDFLLDSSFLSWDFKKMDWNEAPPIPPLGSLSTKEQESVLIDDLLYVLIGTEGRYIRMQPSSSNPHKHTIGVERGGDELVYTAATRIIRICPLYSTIVHFAEDVNYGLVNQAMAGTVRELIKDYLVLISNIQATAKRNEMTLSTMNLQLLPFYYIMKALKEIVDGISKSSFYGGHTLSILHNRIVNFAADLKVQDFCLNLMQTASEPYFEILHGWLYMGVLEDPFGEFFICDNEKKFDDLNDINSDDINTGNCDTSFNGHHGVGGHYFNHHHSHHGAMGTINDDQSWEKRFTCDYSKVPEFLRSLESMILGAGKYICVVRRYGKNNFKPLDYEPLYYTPEPRIYNERVQRAYKFASKELLNLLMDEKDLIGRLHSIKRYFLMESGDFFVQFTDMAEDELAKAMDDIDHIRLESLLELALRTSGCERDPYKDDLRVQFTAESLFVQMSHINNITAEISAKMGLNGSMTTFPGTIANPTTPSSKQTATTSTFNNNNYHQQQQQQRLPERTETASESNYSTSASHQNNMITSDYCLSSSSQLMGWEALVLAYDVKWPLSIIMTEKCQTCYQLIFRHLFCCKYVELQLQGTWKAMQQTRMQNINQHLELAFALRQKMLNFVQNLLYHMMIELIEPNFNSFINKVKNNEIESVDEVIKLHSDFVTGILQDSMLTTTEMLQHITRLLVLCMEYSVITNSMCQKLKRNAQPQQKQQTININNKLPEALLLTIRQFQDNILDMNDKFDNELRAMIQLNPSASTIKWLKLTSRLE